MLFSKIAGTAIAFLSIASEARTINSSNYSSSPKVRRGHSSPRVHRREVPQEHSHEKILTAVRTQLNKNNPDKIQDPVFALLGNAAAAAGAGNIKDPDCLQQAVADQAFTNAKAANDVDGMVAALQFRALERNSGAVGQASAACTSIKAVNPEIAALEQHQDPASTGAAALNKQIVLDLAVEIASVGGDPQLALETGTFAPGQIGDPTAKGNSCDETNDPVGCIFTQNLLVEDATADEINAAVADACGGDANTGSNTSTGGNTSTGNGTATGGNSTSTGNNTSTGNSTSTGNNAATGGNTGSSTALSFGTCSPPSIEGGLGFDGRKEFSFQPVDKTDYNHGSAQNIGIIADFNCDTLINKCGLTEQDQGTIACRAGQAAVGNAKDDGALADKFNSFLGVTTNFAQAAGSTSATGGAATGTGAATGNATGNNTTTGNAATGGNAAAGGNTATGGNAATGAATDFGKCAAPTIEGGLGFDGRKEFSFQPINKADFPHGSAQNIGIITQANCDQLVNACGLNQQSAGLLLCRQAQNAVGAGKDDGSLADKFNAFFGVTTDFKNAQGSTTAATASTGGNAATSTTGENAATSTTGANTATSTATGNNGASSAISFGSCSNPSIVFGRNSDRPNEDAFAPANLADFNHGSALGIGVITSFICQQLNDKCKASQGALDACAKGQVAAGSATGQAAADAFNSALGL